MRRPTARTVADYRVIAALRPDTLPTSEIGPDERLYRLGQLDRLRQQLKIANGEWADDLEGQIKVLERMLAEVVTTTDHRHGAPV